MKFPGLKALPVMALCVWLNACCKTDETIHDRARMNFWISAGNAGQDTVLLDIQKLEIENDYERTPVLLLHPGIYNLASMQQQADTILGTAWVRVGKVKNIRLVTGPGSRLIRQGAAVPLYTNDSTQAELNFPPGFDIDGEYDIRLSIDIGRSLKHEGTLYTFWPRIKAYTAATSGGIKGRVQAGAPATVQAINGNDTTAVAAGPDGNYLLQGLPAGTYMIYVVSGSNTRLIPGVLVWAGRLTQMGTGSAVTHFRRPAMVSNR